MVIPVFRHFYELDIPDVWGLVVIGLAVFSWTVLVRTLWRLDLVRRLRNRLRHSPADGPR
jgi:hypothetical protein